jgi:hypothetical protein
LLPTINLPDSALCEGSVVIVIILSLSCYAFFQSLEDEEKKNAELQEENDKLKSHLKLLASAKVFKQIFASSFS